MKPNPESLQMPKQSRVDERAKLMSGGSTKKSAMKKVSSDTAKPKQKAPRSSGGVTSSDIAKGKTVNIHMKELSPGFKQLIVEELIRSARARVVTRKGRASMAKEQQK